MHLIYSPLLNPVLFVCQLIHVTSVYKPWFACKWAALNLNRGGKCVNSFIMCFHSVDQNKEQEPAGEIYSITVVSFNTENGNQNHNHFSNLNHNLILNSFVT